MDGLAPQTEVMDSYLWRNAAGTTLLWLDGAPEVPAVSGWPASNMFHQPDLERLLAEAVSRQPGVTIRPGHDVRDVVVGSAAGNVSGMAAGEMVSVQADGPGGGRAQVRARWVIGCDGADSRIRQLAGLDVTDHHYQAQWLIVDVRPAEPVRWSPLNIQVCDPARPTTAVSGGPGRRRFEFMRLPDDPQDDFDSPSTAWRLLEPWGLTPANGVLERHALYTFGARLVDRWRRGRLLVAGDAAHQMPPFAGQGLCSGLRDAANLAWKLDLVLAGPRARNPAGQLRHRATEPGPRGDRLFRRAREDHLPAGPGRGRGQGPGLRAVRRGRPHAAAGPATPRPRRLASRRSAGRPAGPAGTGRPGRIASPPGRCHGRRLDPARPDRRRNPAGELPAELARWWTSLGGRCLQLAPGGPRDDSTGAYGRWFGTLERDTVLIRPDSYLFGTATGPGAAAGLVDALRSALEGEAIAATGRG